MIAVLLACAAAAVGAFPLVRLVELRRLGQHREAAWWWMAVAFGVSFIADAFGAFGWHPLAHQVYPASQTALIALTLADRRVVVAFVALVLAVAASSILVRDGLGLDLWLRVVAFGGVTALAWWYVPAVLLRSAFLVYFGLGLLAWWAFTEWSNWWTYGGMQGVRAAGIALWCRAATRV